MKNPTSIAIALIAAAASALVWHATLGPATAAGPSDKPGLLAEPPGSNEASPAEQPAIVPRGRVYLFRGALGPIFSRGMDHLTERLDQVGVTASVHEFTLCTFVADDAIRDYRADPAPITLIGHSMGGSCALKFAEWLQEKNIPVSLIITIDPAHISDDVPLNVERYINIFLSKDILGGGDVKPTKGYQGHYASYDLSQHEEVNHITIDKMDSVHDQLVAKILEIPTTPARADGNAAPIRYVVPADAEIELWDSGMPVFAHSGDTLQTLTASHHLPLWSLTQINPMPDGALLTTGQRVIIPRHLMPVTAAKNSTVLGHAPSKF
jgi:hypothetical protein